MTLFLLSSAALRCDSLVLLSFREKKKEKQITEFLCLRLRGPVAQGEINFEFRGGIYENQLFILDTQISVSVSV